MRDEEWGKNTFQKPALSSYGADGGYCFLYCLRLLKYCQSTIRISANFKSTIGTKNRWWVKPVIYI